MGMIVSRSLGADGSGSVGRILAHGVVLDRHLGAVGLEQSASLAAEDEAALDGRRLRVALPVGVRLARAGGRATMRPAPHLPLPLPQGSPGQVLSPSERTRSAQIGGWLFRHRGLLPVPLVVLGLCAPGVMTSRAWGAGLMVMALGETLRLAGVAVAGPETRRRSRAVAHLVTHGPFAWVRNPLYVGNGLAWLGMAIASGVAWLIPIGIVIFAVQYGLIVRYEEGVLETLFGAAYLTYKGRTPRWIPRRPAARPRPVGRHFDWRGAWRSESSTFASLAVAISALIAKAMLTR
jgi:protein-S-isoprenylcysteine O-methyltransferase Ste14